MQSGVSEVPGVLSLTGDSQNSSERRRGDHHRGKLPPLNDPISVSDSTATKTFKRLLVFGGIICIIIGIVTVKYDLDGVKDASVVSGTLPFKTGNRHLIYSSERGEANNLIQMTIGVHSLSGPADRIAICVFPNDFRPQYKRNSPCGGSTDAQVIPEATGNDGDDDIIVESPHVYAVFTSDENKKWDVCLENHNILKPINVEFTVSTKIIAQNTLKYWWHTINFLTSKVSFLFRSLGLKLRLNLKLSHIEAVISWFKLLRPTSCASLSRIPLLHYVATECKIIMIRYHSNFGNYFKNAFILTFFRKKNIIAISACQTISFLL